MFCIYLLNVTKLPLKRFVRSFILLHISNKNEVKTKITAFYKYLPPHHNEYTGQVAHYSSSDLYRLYCSIYGGISAQKPYKVLTL